MKKNNTKKDTTINIRVSEKQKNYLINLSNATGKSLSECVREIIDMNYNNKVIMFDTKENFILKKQIKYEINRIGNNINQIVHNVNMEFYSISEKKYLKELLENINNIVSQKL